MTREPDPTELMLIVLGDNGVGKSALTVMFTSELFVSEYDPTNEDSFKRIVTVDDKKYLLNILDTAVNGESSYLRDTYLRSSQGFLFLFSISDRRSFESVNNYYHEVRKIQDDNTIALILVGCKQDHSDFREVSVEEAQLLAGELNMDYIETSAKTNYNVRECFLRITRKVIEQQEFGETCAVVTSEKEKKSKDECQIA